MGKTTRKTTVEGWWVETAGQLSSLMKLSGVEKFVLRLTERGTYTFEVTPVGWDEWDYPGMEWEEFAAFFERTEGFAPNPSDDRVKMLREYFMAGRAGK